MPDSNKDNQSNKDMHSQYQALHLGSKNIKQYAGSGFALLVDIILSAFIGWLAAVFSGDAATGAIVGFVIFLILLAMSIRVVSEWNRMPVLRLGRYKGIIGPGFVTIFPIIESTPFTVDLRVISTTFSAEQTLTRDNVPVNVDAILFWQVNNPEQTILNVQSYFDSVQLAAQTALRDIIGKSALSEMLAGRDIIGKDIDALIAERVAMWGIKAISVEIRDVKIPKELQDAMAKVAIAEREKGARVTLAASESLAADKMLEASKKYQSDLYAMQLRALNMMYEISLNGRNLMIFVPTENKGVSMPTPLGVLGLQDISNLKKEMQKRRQGKK
ncbi:MAG: slipin family protein [Candidatus Micrarchaeota archaeon]|nr:slipin family protein [Candidatus Micrarchaeota archaeon]